MPGISFICDFSEELIKKKSTILKALDSLIHFDHYKKNILLREKSYFLGITAYDEYPITSYENDEYLIYLEGKIYGKDYSETDIALNKLARLLFQSQNISKEKVSEWLLNTDGDFVIFILNKKSKEISIINDILGRLPLYYYSLNGQLLISREVRFIANLIDSKNFDKMAIAQTLLFGYSLGKRTLLENIYRLEPATKIQIRLEDARIDMKNIFQFNFDEKKNSKRKINENARNLTTLFSEACKNRANSFSGYKKVATLSGGLDSRAVAACLKNNDILFEGITYLDFHKRAELDSIVAKSLANTINIDWQLFNLSPPKGKDFYKLLEIKNGLNYFGMSYILSFFNLIKEKYGSKVIYFTGDGGQIIKPELRVFQKVKNIDELVNFIIWINKKVSLDDVADLTQLSKSEIVNEIKNRILSYPEKKWSNKYSHFLIYEENVNSCFEGEDRNRFYFWSMTPFYSNSFFNYAMNCPDWQISKFKLCREFLLEISPQISAINNAEWKMPITSKKLNSIFFYHRLPSSFKKIIRSLLKRPIPSYKHNSTIENCILEQLNNCQLIDKYLSNTAIQDFIHRCDKYQFEYLFTITSCLEAYKSQKSSLERYFDSDFS